MRRRFVALLMALVMELPLVPTTVFAAEEGDLPKAKVQEYTDMAEFVSDAGVEDFPICDFLTGASLDNVVYYLAEPDCGYKFSAADDADRAKQSDFAKWPTDYTISFDKPVAKDSTLIPCFTHHFFTDNPLARQS